MAAFEELLIDRAVLQALSSHRTKALGVASTFQDAQQRRDVSWLAGLWGFSLILLGAARARYLVWATKGSDRLRRHSSRSTKAFSTRRSQLPRRMFRTCRPITTTRRACSVARRARTVRRSSRRTTELVRWIINVEDTRDAHSRDECDALMSSHAKSAD
jgi:hypothetical protein